MGLADDFRGMFHGLLRGNASMPEANVNTSSDGYMVTVEIDKTGQMDITLNDDLSADDLKAMASQLRRAANFVSHQSSLKRWNETHQIVEHD